jgi:hypothetical protein
VAFERCRSAVSEVRDRLPPSAATDFQFKLGTGLARFGQSGRAREALEQALGLAEAHRLNAWYFRIEKALQQLSLLQTDELQHKEAGELSHPPVVEEPICDPSSDGSLSNCRSPGSRTTAVPARIRRDQWRQSAYSQCSQQPKPAVPMR